MMAWAKKCVLSEEWMLRDCTGLTGLRRRIATVAAWGAVIDRIPGTVGIQLTDNWRHSLLPNYRVLGYCRQTLMRNPGSVRDVSC